MASQQPPQTEQSGTKPTARRYRLRLLWPAAAVGLGIALIHNSLVTAPVAHPKHTNRPAAVASRAPAQAEPSAHASPSPSPSLSPSPSISTGTGTGTKVDDKSLRRSQPTRLSIPDIGVDAPFTKLSVNASGRLNPPPADNTNMVGWFKGGPSPGERGASIVVGHLDTKTGPAVFAELESLEPGAVVDITRADGTVARFKVDSIDSFSKADFPDDKVYADTATPQLRLITCGGNFDRANHGYEENVVVFAHLDSSSRS
ncbi:class F sortase [Streptomyces sp. NPDC001292]|uniref:class F sortase n=1 Tax=Streptomyces sp. NPDC001292 TaxID=3364558 RepID=UPI0036A1102B